MKKVTKLRNMRWTGLDACMRRPAIYIEAVVGETDGKNHYGGLMCRTQNNITVVFKEMG
jgi:hypothetical protein